MIGLALIALWFAFLLFIDIDEMQRRHDWEEEDV